MAKGNTSKKVATAKVDDKRLPPHLKRAHDAKMAANAAAQAK